MIEIIELDICVDNYEYWFDCRVMMKEILTLNININFEDHSVMKKSFLSRYHDAILRSLLIPSFIMTSSEIDVSKMSPQLTVYSVFFANIVFTSNSFQFRRTYFSPFWKCVHLCKIKIWYMMSWMIRYSSKSIWSFLSSQYRIIFTVDLMSIYVRQMISIFFNCLLLEILSDSVVSSLLFF